MSGEYCFAHILGYIEALEVAVADISYTALSDFTAEILLNIAPSDPVNALARTTIRVSPASHAIDYALDMPDDVSSST